MSNPRKSAIRRALWQLYRDGALARSEASRVDHALDYAPPAEILHYYQRFITQANW